MTSRKFKASVIAGMMISAGLHAQVVIDMSEQGGGVVTTTPEDALRGDEYWADGIIEDWGSILKDFEKSETDNTKIENQLSVIHNVSTNTIKIKGKVYRIPEMLDENGIDMYLLTKEGITLYMALDGPAYYQETTDELIKWIRYYAFSKRNYTKLLFKRYEQWEGAIKSCFGKFGIPTELAELCLIESGCTSSARSSAGALGMWQLMPQTARQYGLVVGKYQDDRLDPNLSMIAAAKMLKDCYKKTGEWTLAAAAYNCGVGNILKYRTGRKSDWTDIKPYLPLETRQYIPSLLAIHYVWHNRQKLKI